MKKNNKIKIEDIVVSSFITSFQAHDEKTFNGAAGAAEQSRGCLTFACLGSAACGSQEALCSFLSCSVEPINQSANSQCPGR